MRRRERGFIQTHHLVMFPAIMGVLYVGFLGIAPPNVATIGFGAALVLAVIVGPRTRRVHGGLATRVPRDPGASGALSGAGRPEVPGGVSFGVVPPEEDMG